MLDPSKTIDVACLTLEGELQVLTNVTINSTTLIRSACQTIGSAYKITSSNPYCDPKIRVGSSELSGSIVCSFPDIKQRNMFLWIIAAATVGIVALIAITIAIFKTLRRERRHVQDMLDKYGIDIRNKEYIPEDRLPFRIICNENEFQRVNDTTYELNIRIEPRAIGVQYAATLISPISAKYNIDLSTEEIINQEQDCTITLTVHLSTTVNERLYIDFRESRPIHNNLGNNNNNALPISAQPLQTNKTYSLYRLPTFQAPILNYIIDYDELLNQKRGKGQGGYVLPYYCTLLLIQISGALQFIAEHFVTEPLQSKFIGQIWMKSFL